MTTNYKLILVKSEQSLQWRQ